METCHDQVKPTIQSYQALAQYFFAIVRTKVKNLFHQLSDYPYRPLLLPPSQCVGAQAPIGGASKCHNCTQHKCTNASGSLRSLDQHQGVMVMQSNTIIGNPPTHLCSDRVQTQLPLPKITCSASSPTRCFFNTFTFSLTRCFFNTFTFNKGYHFKHFKLKSGALSQTFSAKTNKARNDTGCGILGVVWNAV